MANVHAAIKAIRQSARRRVQNQAVLTELKTHWKKLGQLTKAELAKAKTLASELVSKWDRAVSNGVVPKGRADRKKARIAHWLVRLADQR